MTLYTKDLSTRETQYFLQHLVAPRPVCFASTTDREGKVNLSPFSFFNLFSTNPPIVIFSPSRRGRDNTTKHTLENVKEVPEVVVNIVSYDMVQQVSLASCEYPKGTDEFLKAGFTKETAILVKPPMVMESKAKLECRVTEIKSLGNEGGAGQLVIAEVLCMHINDELLTPDKQFDPEKLDLVARLGGNWYTKVTPTNIFMVEKPNTSLGMGIDALPELIRNSKVLTGNDLARLANKTTLPSKEPAFNDDRLESLLMINESGLKDRLHAYAKELIAEGKIDQAWQALLAFEND